MIHVQNVKILQLRRSHSARETLKLRRSFSIARGAAPAVNQLINDKCGALDKVK